MKSHNDLSDSEFEHQFATCTLNPDLFSHEAHLRLAWIHISTYGVDNAEYNIQKQLKIFVSFLGATDKYHHTVTIVAVRAVNHFMKSSNANNFKSFIIEFPQLKTDFKALKNSHYSIDIFTSQAAKVEFLEPDEFPFK